MLEWAADQTMEITTTAIDLEFLPTDSNDGEEFRGEWHCCQLAEEPTGGLEPSSHDHFSGTLLSPGTPSEKLTLGVLCFSLREEAEGQDGRQHQAGWPGSVGAIGAWEARDFRLQSPANFWRCTSGNRNVRGGEVRFENSCFQAEWHGCSWTLRSHGCWCVQLSLSRLAKESGHQIRAMGVLRAMHRIFNETAIQARTPASKRLAKAIRASHGPRVSLQAQAKERVKRTKENPKDAPKEPRARTKVPKEKCRKWDRLTMARRWFMRGPDERNDGWSFDEWNDDRNCVGLREDCEQTHVTSVSSFSLESSAWAKMNLDTGAAVNTFPSNFGPAGIGDGSFYDWIPDGENLAFSRIRWKWFAQISEWKINGRTRSVEQQRISLCISTSIKSCGDRLQRTTRMLCETQWWLHDSYSQQSWSGNENSFWEIVERVWKERAHCSLSREWYSQFLPEPNSEVWRNLQCESGRAAF